MDGRAVKVFLACVLGAGIGSVVALSLHSYLWWIGLLVGGAVGYFSYEFREVLRGTRVAAKVAWHETGAITPVVLALIFRTITSPEFRAGIARVSMGFLPSIALAGSLTFLYLGLDAYVPWKDATGQNNWGFTIGFVGFIVMMVAIIVPLACGLDKKQDGRYAMRTKTLGIIALCLTPIGLGLLVVVGIGWTLFKSPKIAKFCAVFVKTLFLTIHSDVRLLCGVDAAIGALIGFFLMNPIIGAVAGGIIGVLNYKLISQKWLRLRPREQNG